MCGSFVCVHLVRVLRTTYLGTYSLVGREFSKAVNKVENGPGDRCAYSLGMGQVGTSLATLDNY